MSTKINARSPFYIEAEEPTVALGAFTCTTAGLTDFRVNSDGTIIDPLIRKGSIISQDHTSFAANTSGSAISRTVNYTILIPSEYTNSNDGTIVCPQTFDQPTQTASEDPTQNDNCPSFSGTISNITGLDNTGSSITLNSFFSEGADANIDTYRVIQYGDAAITHSFSGTGLNQTVTFTTGLTCAEASFKIEAQNDQDSCVARSNLFTISANCPSVTLTCTTDDSNNDAINLQGGSIAADGTISSPSFQNALNIKRIEDSGNSTITSYPANTTGSARDVTLTFVFDILSEYTNSGEIECDKTFSQPPTNAPLETLSCGDDRIVYENFRIATTGDILQGEASVLVNGVSVDFTVNTLGVTTGTAFPEVAVTTPRTIGVAITVPSGWANAGSTIGGTVGSACNQSVQQPPTKNLCVGVTGTYYITSTGVDSLCGFCDFVTLTNLEVNGTIAVNEPVCRNGNQFNGAFKWFGVSNFQNTTIGDVGIGFTVARIDAFGFISEIRQVNCESGECAGGSNNILI